MLEIILVLSAIYLLIVLGFLFRIENEVRKGNKDQQEIKTRLTWIKKRQIGILKAIVSNDLWKIDSEVKPSDELKVYVKGTRKLHSRRNAGRKGRKA